MTSKTVLALSLIFILSCSSNTEAIDLKKSKGKTIYNSNCIRCHNSNPRLEGSVGPEVYGSYKELLEVKLKTGQYPKNYNPKRKSKIMPTFSYTDAEIESLESYLNE